MGIIVDVIVIGIILLSTFLAYRKGFTKLAISLLAVVIAVVATLILYIPVTNFVIEYTGIDEAIEDTIIENSSNIVTENTSEGLSNLIFNEGSLDMIQEVAEETSTNIIKVGVILILFFGIRIGLVFVKALANLIAKLPILKQIDKIGGVIYGILRGIILIYTILLIIGFFKDANELNTVNKYIEESYVTKLMYEYNILETLV